MPILMSAAFDDDLVKAIATIISTEARAFNNFNHAGLDFWTPNINPYRDPRWGRGHETPGEDPFHIKAYTKSLLQGLQGDDNSDVLKIVPTCKVGPILYNALAFRFNLVSGVSIVSLLFLLKSASARGEGLF